MNLKLKRIVGCFSIFVCVFAFLFVGFVEATSVSTVSVGGMPYALAVTPDGSFVYVPNGEDVAVIDTATSKVVERVNVGVNPSDVAVSPNGEYVYVTNRDFDGEGSVSVIRVATNTVTSTIVVGGDPLFVVVSSDGLYVYVLKSEFVDVGGGYYQSFGVVSVVSTATHSVLSNITVGRGPSGLAVSPDGNHLYVTTVEGLLFVVDPSLKTETASITVSDAGLRDVVVSPDGKYVYVVGFMAVFVVSTESDAVVAVVSDLGAPMGLALSTDGDYVYVTENWNNTVSAINTATNLVDFSIDAGVVPYGVVVSPDGKYLYVSNLDYVATDSPVVTYVGTVSVISTDPDVFVFGSSSIWLWVVIVMCAVVVAAVAFLVIIRIKCKKTKTAFSTNSNINNNVITKPQLISQFCVFV